MLRYHRTVATVITGCLFTAATAVAAVDSTLVLNMPCDNSAADMTPYANNGQLINTAPAPDRFGHPGKALSFNGSTSRIVVHDAPSINPANQLTIAFWLRFDSAATNYMDVFSKGGTYTTGFANREYAVFLKDNLGPRYVQFMSAGDGSYQHETRSSSFSPGQWVFFTGVVDRKNHTMAVYLDGMEESSYVTTDSYSTFNVNPYDLWIGGSEEGFMDHTPFKGAIDDIRMYRRALSPAEILALYGTPSDTLPHLDVSSVHDFGNVLAGSSAVQPIRIRNNGTADLVIGAIQCSSPRFVVSDSVMTLTGGDTATILLSYAPLAPGRDTAHITISSNDAATPVRVIPIGGTGIVAGRAPVILSIRDMPSDQGHQVRVLWLHSTADGGPDSIHATFYDVWRGIPAGAAGWDYLGSVPAVHLQAYGLIVPTIADSGTGGPIPWSVYRVSVRFQEATAPAFSPPDSGYSTDNIPPAKVTGAHAFVSGNRATIFWDAVADPDLAEYEIFVAAENTGTIAGMKLAGRTQNLMFVDSTTVLGPVTYYRVVAVDRSGSLGTPSDLMSIRTTSVPDMSTVTSQYALDQNYPNPFNPTTRITYRVAVAGMVHLGVFDVLGQEVAVLVAEHKEPGIYEAQFDARGLSSGTYLYRMTAGPFVQTRHMLLLK